MTTWDWPGSIVARVIDGDSIVATLVRDIGFHGSTTFQQHLRLNRINTPPVSTPLGIAARLFVRDFTFGELLHVVTVKPYKYGDEWMAEVTNDDDDNLSDELVKRGFGVYWDGAGPRPGG